MWNHRNYWVNMTPAAPLTSLTFDLSNSDVWEYVLIDPFNQPVKAVGDSTQVRCRSIP